MKPVPDDGTNSAAGYGAAQAGRATCAERAREASAVESKQLVTVGGAPGIFLGTDLNSVTAVLEALDGPLSVVDF